jgi:N6-adenosine-specific RNA methylase IME4
MANDLVTLDEIAAEIRATYADLLQSTTERALKIGGLLLKAKRQVGHGGWEIWLSKHVNFTDRMARKYMQLVRAPLSNRNLFSVLADNEEKTRAKKQARATRETELGSKQAVLPNKKYGVIVADPEWRFEPWSRETGMDRAADNHYPTSPTEEIAARGTVALGLKALSIAADDCVLFLWATAPMIEAALEVMGAWGFDYKSQFVWIKHRVGTGYWNRNKHELLLIGTRGNIPAPAPGTQWDSAIEAPAGKHSAKPKCFLDMIDVYFPTLPKIELNRRGPPRPGWDAWGNEAEAAE